MECNKIISDKVESIPLKKWKEWEDKNKLIPEIKELDEYITQCKENLKDLTTSKIRLYDTKQLTMKLAGNGQYGASVASGFRFYNPHMGEGITSQGVEIIQLTQELVDNLGFEVIYGDSVAGDSLVPVMDKNGNIKKVPIESLFIEVNQILDSKEYCIRNDLMTLTFNTNTEQLEWKPITAIMRHKVNKKMYRVTLPDKKYVDVTEDHSLIGKFNGTYQEIKPTNLEPLIQLIQLQELDSYSYSYWSTILELEDCENYVYDISVEDNHNFFANDILVHNTDSMFIRLDEHIPEEVKQKGNDEVKKYIYEHILPNIYEHINKALDEHARNIGIPESRKHYFEMKQEMIGRKMLLLEDRAGKGYAKKRYLIHIIDEEGVKQDKIKAAGVEIRRSELPKFLKERIWKFIEGFMKDEMSNEEMLNYLIQVKDDLIKEIENKNIKSFGRLVSVKNLNEYKDIRTVQQAYGTYLWNKYIAPKFNVTPIESGQKVLIVNIIPKSIIMTDELKELYDLIKSENLNYFVFNPVVDVEKVDEIFTIFDIDKDATLEKMFYNQISPYMKALGLSLENLRFGISNINVDDLI